MSAFVIDEDAPVLVELTPGPGVRKASLSVDEIAKKSADALDRAMNTVHHMARRLHATIDALVEPPSEVEAAFGLKFDAESGVLIAKAGLEASINVKLTWKRKET